MSRQWDAARLIKSLTKAGHGKRGMDIMLYEVNAAIAAVEAERDDWERRCKNLVNAMAVHGYSAETLANIAEGRDNG